MVARWRAGRKKRARGRYASLFSPFHGPLRLASSPVIRVSQSPFCATKCENLGLRSTLSKTDTFGTGTKCWSKSDVCPIESHINGEKKARQGPTLDVGLTEVSVRES